MAAAMLFPVKALGVSAQKAIVLDSASGRVLYGKLQNERSLIASTTKIMTALVVCQQCNVLDRFRIPKEAVGIEGSSMYLKEGEILTIQELLYGLMLQSGNDAAVALAIYCGGTVEGFVQMMNDKAALLGLSNTYFANPHGLDASNHYSTARDLAVLSAYAMSDPIFSMTVSTKTVTVGERYLKNHNKLLWRIEGADGVKTGYTKAAGRILVSSVSRDNRRLICVTINAPDDWNDHIKLLEHCYRNYKSVTFVSEGQSVGRVYIAGGTSGWVDLIAAETFELALADNENVVLEMPGIGFVYAPIKAGEEAGIANVLIDGQYVGSVKLLFGETVKQYRESKHSIWQKFFG